MEGYEESVEKVKGPNILEDFNASVDAVMQVEKQWHTNTDPREVLKEKDIIRDQIGMALSVLMQKRESMNEDEISKFNERSVTGFQGIGGANRYLVYGDGRIGLTQSHSISPCIKKAQELGIETPEYGF